MSLHPMTALKAVRHQATCLSAVFGVACALTLLLASFAPTASAEESLKDGARRAGHAFGTAIHDLGHGAKEIGKDIGHDAKQAGKAVGNAAKEGGREFKQAIKGKD